MNDDINFDEDHALDMVLNNMIDEIQKVRIRNANESDYVIISNFNSKHFDIEKEFDYDYFGKYNGEYVMINKEDYNNTML